MEPSEEQYQIINALQTLELLLGNLYEPSNGVWYIETPSLVLPIAAILQSGDIIPIEWVKNDDNNG